MWIRVKTKMSKNKEDLKARRWLNKYYSEPLAYCFYWKIINGNWVFSEIRGLKKELYNYLLPRKEGDKRMYLICG